MSVAAARLGYRLPLGVALGLAASAAALSVYPRGEGGPPQADGTALLSECDGAIREVVVHYPRETADVVAPALREMLRQLPAGVIAHVVCPCKEDFDDLASRVGGTDCGLSPVIVDHPITAWSRDRWLGLESPGGAAVLLCPRSEDGADVWPARAGDQRVAGDLAAALGPGVAARRSGLFFDGGDVASDGETAFVRPAVVLRNLQRTVATREELQSRLESMLHRRVVVFRRAPDHHVAMYMVPVGERTVLVGDPRMAQRLLAEAGPRAETAVAAYLPGGPDFTDETAAGFESVAGQCREAGYRVVRIPVVPARDGRTFVTYVNAILDQRGGHRTAYMPVFGCAEVLNRAATRTWTALGYEVRPVACDACAKHFGAIHCLVNVLRRSNAKG